jgi:hypothetical protein
MTILTTILMASALISTISIGETLPPLRGEFLTGRQAQLPEAASGRVALLALGFTYNSRFQVEAWIGRFRKDFGENPHVTFYEIPMIGGMARLGKWFIDSGMRKGTPRSDQENVITVYGGTDSWKQHMGYQSPDAAYLVLIDKHGAVRWRHSGAFDEEAYKDLSVRVTALLREP